jgi:hypothetical protein
VISQRFVARRLPFAAYEIKAGRRNNEGFTVKREVVDVFALKTIFCSDNCRSFYQRKRLAM